jgi:hypothetical protein
MTDQEFIKLPWNHPCADHWNSGRTSEVLHLMKVGDSGRQACKEGKLLHHNPFLYVGSTAERDQWEKSYLQAHKDRLEQVLKDKATQEFYSKANGLYPSNAKTIREFSNGVNQVTNCYWDSSCGCRVYFTTTVFSRGGHSTQVTNVEVKP